MSLLVTSVLVASGVLFGRWIARGGGKATPNAPPVDAAGGSGAPSGEPARNEEMPKPSAPPPDPLEEMPCALGDVVMRAGGDEAWLAGAAIFSEDRPVAALFVAPEAKKDRAIFVRARPSEQLLWLEPLSPSELVLGSEPPTSLEHGTTRFDRVRRLPVKVARIGSGAPDLGDSAVLAEYASGGFQRLIVVIAPGTSRAWVGIALEPGMYEVLPSGKSTLS